MQTRTLKLVQVAGSVALFAAASTLPAAASEHHKMHRHHAAYDRPLTVRHYHEPIVAAAPAPRDPFAGPAGIVTGPVAVAGTVVGLPFQAVNAVFPAYGDPATNPLVLVGAPAHFAGQVVGFPFYAVNSSFGAPANYY
jgi:hypothetical protein